MLFTEGGIKDLKNNGELADKSRNPSLWTTTSDVPATTFDIIMGLKWEFSGFGYQHGNALCRG